MTSSQLTGENSEMDPAEAMRPLMAELRSLVDRLELPDDDATLARSLHAAQEQVAGPRAIVMLLGEREDLKRQFLERLLGPGVEQLPNRTTVCTLLEYGASAECTVTMPLGMTSVIPLGELKSFPGELAMLSIRMPDPALRAGLALIDTPAAEHGDPDARVLESMEQADVWIYVLDADYTLSESGLALLRAIPEQGERLELVIENAGSINGVDRDEARERLMETLRQECGIGAPRLTVVDANGEEGDDQNVWHGRFATFHSVMMLRGRERRLEKTRAAVSEALSMTEQAIDRELANTPPGPRQARLRLGMKEVQALSSRFHGEEPPHEEEAQNSLGGIWSGANENAADHAPLTLLAEAMAAGMAPESAEAAELAALHPRPAADEELEQETTESKPAEPSSHSPEIPAAKIPVSMEQAFGIPSPADKMRQKRGVSVRFSGGAGRFLRGSEFVWWRRAIGIAIIVLLICLILWALSPRGFFNAREDPGSWEYHPPQPAPPAAALVSDGDTEPPEAGAAAPLPDTGETATPDLRSMPLEKPSAAVRIPLAKPIPRDARAGAAPPRQHHHHLLGLGKLWHWIHPGRPKTTED